MTGSNAGKKSTGPWPRIAEGRSAWKVLLGIGILIFVGCGKAPGNIPIRTISGTVTGTAVAGVTVGLSGTKTASTTTDSAGHYRFSGLVDGTYRATPALSGYVFAPADVPIVLKGSDADHVDFTSTSAGGVHSISGTVTGPGMEGVTLVLTGVNTATTTADSTGKYTFNGVGDGTYSIAPSKGGHVFRPAGVAVKMAGADLSGYDFAVTPGVHPTYVISGTVMNGGSGLGGVVVNLDGTNIGSAVTDSAGNYSFGGLLNGSYTVTPSLEGYSFTPASLPVTVGNGNMLGQGFVATPHNFSISGQVTGSIKANVSLILRGDNGITKSVKTNPQGGFVFTSLDAGRYTVTPSLPGYSFTPPSISNEVTNASVFLNQMFTSEADCRGRWCWENPKPQGNTLYGVWTSGETNAWAVGGAGTILHWDGMVWSNVNSGTTLYLWSIWGSGEDDIWVVGEGGTILHWDGMVWSNVNSGTTFNLWSIWGSGSNDIWIVGDNGTILHWNGAWSKMETLATDTLRRVWGSGPNDVWISLNPRAGTAGVLHWDGTKWTLVNIDRQFSGIWGSGPNDVWAVTWGSISHWNGASWSRVETPYLLTGIWGSGPNDVWAAGETTTGGIDGRSVILHWEGKNWALVDSGNTNSLYSIQGSGPGNVWAVGEGGALVHWSGNNWSQHRSGPIGHLAGIWGSNPNDIWTAGNGGTILHWNGTDWSSVPSGTAQDLLAVWGSSPGDVWTVGRAGTILHWNGTDWSSVPSGTAQDLLAIWGSGSRDVWAVGASGTALHWDGTNWSQVSSGTTYDLRCVWGDGTSNFWIGGGDWRIGIIIHWNGVIWEPVDAGTHATFTSIWGSGPNDIWAIVSGLQFCRILHWDGSVWTSKSTSERFAIRGTGKDNVWAVGSRGAALHWDGRQWATVRDATSAYLSGIWCSGSDVWAVGHYGAVLHYRQ